MTEYERYKEKIFLECGNVQTFIENSEYKKAEQSIKDLSLILFRFFDELDELDIELEELDEEKD